MTRTTACSAAIVCLGAQVVCAQTPRLVLRRIIGDLRGRGTFNQSVAVDDQGVTYLLMRSGRLAVFEPDGSYRDSRYLQQMRYWSHRYYVAASQNRVFLGNFPADFAWLSSVRRVGTLPGRFRNARAAAIDEQGRVYVADMGNRRVQVFAAEDAATPVIVLPLKARPYAVTVRGADVAVMTDDQQVRLFRRDQRCLRLRAVGRVGPGAQAVAIGPRGRLFVAYGGGPNRFDLKRFVVRDDTIEQAAVIAPTYTKLWPNLLADRTPLVTGPNGHVWFTCRSRGCVLSLDPATDRVRERVRGLRRPTSLQFDRAGRLYVGIDGPGIVRFPAGATTAKQGRPFLAKGRLYKQRSVPIWGLLPDRDDGVYVRVVEQGYRKGWPALTLKRVQPDGRMKPFLDFGSLFAVRTRFGPSEALYALAFGPKGNVILAALPLQAVLKAKPDGTILWEAGLQPRGGADSIAFDGPCDLAVDRRGHIWVADVRRSRVSCLSPDGRLLLEHGRFGDIDDRQGNRFHAPTGIAVVESRGRQYLYVADAGNQRLVKYEILW